MGRATTTAQITQLKGIWKTRRRCLESKSGLCTHADGRLLIPQSDRPRARTVIGALFVILRQWFSGHGCFRTETRALRSLRCTLLPTPATPGHCVLVIVSLKHANPEKIETLKPGAYLAGSCKSAGHFTRLASKPQVLRAKAV